MNRKQFLRAGLLLTTGAVLRVQAQEKSSPPPAPPAPNPAAPDRGPALDPALVKDFVVAGHGNLPKVKELLLASPALLNACWDWGGGDFETALGGAAHMGRRDIAEFLIASGTRVDVFAAAMLGQLEIVKAACTAFPNTPKVPGPHKIPLIAHAQKGGPEAGAVLAYLNSIVA